MGRDDALPMVLLDSDAAGKQAVKSLQDQLYQGVKKRVLLTDDYIKDLTDTEIEDLLPAPLLVQVLDRMERLAQQDFEDFHDPKKPIVPQIKSWAKNEGFELVEGWKVQLALGVKSKLLANPDKDVDDNIIEQWTSFFEKFG